MEREKWQKEAQNMRQEIQELQNNLRSVLDENDRNKRKLEDMDLDRTRFQIESQNQKRENEELKREIQKFRREKEESETRNETRVKQLIKLEKEVGVYGAGCYYGDDRQPSDGGQRHGFNENDLRNVLKLLDLGGRVNIKEREF